MATWHCPVCGLDFAFHSELDWHVRETHSLKRSAGLAGQLERESVLSWARLHELQSRKDVPSISLLLWTTPGPVMNSFDAAVLRRLAEQARKDLARRVQGQSLAQMAVRLDEAVLAAKNSPTDHGLAIFVSPSETAFVPLPFPPHEKAVVNHAFATRELLDALQRFPMYRVLLLRGPGFRLLEGRRERLSEVLDFQVPNPTLQHTRPSAWTPRQRAQAALDAADRAIGERVAVVGRLPLVLIGRKGLMRKFLEHSPHASSVVGQVPAWASMQTRTSAAEMAAPLVHAWRESHNAGYRQALTDADQAGEVIWGVEKVWEAVLSGEVARVWVDTAYNEPGRVVDGHLQRNGHTEGPDIVPDAVNMVIERAALAGAHVEMVDRLEGAHGEHIAAQIGHPLGQDESVGLGTASAPVPQAAPPPTTGSAAA